MLNIGLLCGGKSCEHDISIITMLQIKELIKDKYNLYVLYIDKDNQLYLANNMKLSDFKHSNYSSLVKASFVNYGIMIKKKITLIDSMIILNHGINGEDGMSAALLEFYNINYVGSNMYASVIAMDKGYTHQVLSNYDIPLINKIIYRNKDYYNKKKIETSCIIKPARLGSSIGIEISKDKEDFLSRVSNSLIYDSKVVIEDLLKDFNEYNIALYKTDKIYFSNICCINLKHEYLTFDDKYLSSNSKNKNYKYLDNKELIDEIKRISKIAYEELDMSGIVRIDFLEREGKVYLNEINTIPGGLSYYLFDDFCNVIDELIKYSIVSKNSIKDRLDKSILEISSIKK